MSTANVNGTAIYHDEIGAGPACLVLHGGLGLDHTSYRGLDMLADRLRMIYYDHRGNGRSGRPPLDTITMAQLADDAAALATCLNADPVVVIGHSYGGFVGQELALRHPDKIAALILADTSAGGPGATDSPDDDQGPPPPPEWLAAVTARPRDDAEFAAGLRALLPHYLGEPGNLATVTAAFENTIFDARTMVRSMEVLATWSAADRLPAIRVPTLVVVGARDRITHPAQTRRIARRIPGAEVVELPRSGHFPWLEEPDRFATAVRGWLADRLTTAAR
ncbi:MAG TPA: alpha/beta hydrolase [Actinophytocola sp.]|uniref:alpha/beta fold hydrolase n=1 Tax=Actinophytocola sp. TaxID=1872138 RepID=UPI002F93F7E3